MRVRLIAYDDTPPQVIDAVRKRVAHSRAARRARGTVRAAARRRVEAETEARDRLRDARPHGRERLQLVAPRRCAAGHGRHAAAVVPGDAARPTRAGGVDVYGHSLAARVRAMRRPGDRLRALAARVFDAETMERLIDPVIADLQ